MRSEKEAKKRVHFSVKMWKQLELSITPKVHLLEDHASNPMQELNGIADKSEDYIE